MVLRLESCSFGMAKRIKVFKQTLPCLYAQEKQVPFVAIDVDFCFLGKLYKFQIHLKLVFYLTGWRPISSCVSEMQRLPVKRLGLGFPSFKEVAKKINLKARYGTV